MTEWFLSKVGYGKPPENPVLAQRRRELQTQTHQERLNEQYRSAQITCQMKEDEIADLKEEARDHLKRGDKRNAQVKLTRAKELETELVSDRGKLKNLEMQQKKIDSAHSNLNQALLVDESAAELENIASAFEGIDLETAVDRVAEASHTLDTHDDLLSTPMFNGAAQIIDPDEVEADLAQMEAELAGENLMDLPDVPQTTTVKPDKYPVTRIQMKK
jgi:hypothetical protein